MEVIIIWACYFFILTDRLLAVLDQVLVVICVYWRILKTILAVRCVLWTAWGSDGSCSSHTSLLGYWQVSIATLCACFEREAVSGGQAYDHLSVQQACDSESSPYADLFISPFTLYLFRTFLFLHRVMRVLIGSSLRRAVSVCWLVLFWEGTAFACSLVHPWPGLYLCADWLVLWLGLYMPADWLFPVWGGVSACGLTLILVCRLTEALSNWVVLPLPAMQN